MDSALRQHAAASGRAPEVEQRYRTLLKINNAIVTSLKRDQLLHAICEVLRPVLPFDQAGINIYEPETDGLRIHALEVGEKTLFPVGSVFDRKSSASGWVFDHQQPLVRRDLEHEAEYEAERISVAMGIRSLCIVPLSFQGNALGTLIVLSKNIGQYTDADAEFLQEIAGQVALAVGNMKSYEQIAELNNRIRLVLNSAAEAIFGCEPDGTCTFCNEAAARLLGYDQPADLLGKNMHWTEHHSRVDGSAYPLEECPIYRSLLKNEGVHRDDEVFWRKDGTSFPVEYWSHPMVREGKTTGAVVTFVDITERKHAETALRRSEERARSLLEINNGIITSLSEGALLRSIASALRRVVPFDASALTLHMPEKHAFRFLAVEGVVGSFRVGQEIPHAGTSIGWVFDNQKPRLRHDLISEQQYSNERLLAAEGMRSHCVVPLIARGCCIGTLNVASKTANQYSDPDAEFLREVAAQVALAVENMKAYEEINALKARVEAENIYLQEEIRSEHNFEEIVGSSPALIDVLQKIEMVAPTDATVLLSGETGTGKELIARALHARSSRQARTMVSVNCGAIPASLVESELFGHVKGAFTGALERGTGRFELANGSTLFLDEVGELPLETQVKLLRALQEREFQPVGSSRTIRVDVRIIAASNRDLEQAVRTGAFRADLFYRLNVVPVRVPPLRERRSDIPQLVMFFLDRCCKRLGKKIGAVSEETMELLVRYDWPGNIRELQNIIERGVVLSRGPVFTLDSDVFRVPGRAAGSNELPTDRPAAPLKPAQASDLPPVPPLRLADAEKQHILAVLERTGWIIDGPRGAAKILDLHPNTLRGRMKRLAIDRLRH